MGANIHESGATFRVWAPGAIDVYVITNDLAASRQPGWMPRESDRLVRRNDGTWAGFVPGVRDGAPYRFFVVGDGGSGFKRDPWARELGPPRRSQTAIALCETRKCIHGMTQDSGLRRSTGSSFISCMSALSSEWTDRDATSAKALPRFLTSSRAFHTYEIWE